MTSFVAQLITKLYPSEEARLLCVGLDAAGRTSWLYMKLLNEVVTTIPTVGFNVETVKHDGCAFTIWDVGGCDKIRPLWRHYFQNTHGIVFFADSHDSDRMDEMRDELRRLMEAPELRDAFCLVIANKQDLPAALTPSRVAERLQLPQSLRGRHWTCMPGCIHDPEMVRAHFDWLTAAFRHSAAARPAKPLPAAGGADGGGASAAALVSGGKAGAGEPDVLERWLHVADEPDDEFLQKLEDYSLDTWDHRTHLRLAWLYLTRLGRREGLARIHAAIQAFIANSPLTRRKTGTTYHETMTYFWAHMVHFAIASQKAPPGATPDFRLFLLLNPQLTNSGLFLHYYSKKLMLQTPESRVQVVLPDKRPLPSLLTDVAVLSAHKQGPDQASAPTHAPSTGSLLDAEFLDRFLNRTLDRWNHECLLRAIYCCLKRHGRRRGGDIALDALRVLQKEAFHLTINYFWVCMVTHTLASEYGAALFPKQAAEAQAAGAELPLSVSTGAHAPQASGPPFPEWSLLLNGAGYTSVRMKELVADEKRFLKFYSNKVVFSEAAGELFVPPDKRPLPTTA